MNISYGEPLSRGWSRMVNALFNPFDISKWFVAGFTAFLAGLADGPGFGSGSYNPGKYDWDFKKFADLPQDAWEWVAANTLWFTLISIGIILLVAFGILLTWLSSRGKFMFLDNVVHNRALVSRPWNQFKYTGNSLFLWRIFFGIILFAVISLFILAAVSTGYYFHNNAFSGLVTGLVMAGMVIWVSAICIIAGYINLFLSHFIVPIMYKNNIGAVEAWRRFLPLLSGYMLYFFIYGIVIFLIYILIFLCIGMIGLFTCCIGFIILGIPYIGSVILLPVTYTFRALSVEFLEQFGPEYKIFPKQGGSAFNEVYEL